MKAPAAPACPVSIERLEENTARVAALLVAGLVLLGVGWRSPLLLLGVAADFALRAFTAGHWSLVRRGARRLARALGLAVRPTPAAPKKFAAGLGLVFCLLISLSLYLHFGQGALLLTAALLVCALLEGLAGVCVGCYVYTYAVLPFQKPR